MGTSKPLSAIRECRCSAPPGGVTDGRPRPATPADQISPLRLSRSSGSSARAATDSGTKPRSPVGRPPRRSGRRPARRGLARASVGAANTSGSRSRLAANTTAIRIRLLFMDVASLRVNWRFGVPTHSMGNTCRCSERENPAIRDGENHAKALPGTGAPTDGCSQCAGHPLIWMLPPV